MIKENSKYYPITGDTSLNSAIILTRYMDLPKFVDLLRTSELHLAPAVDFEDHLEGTLPEAVRQSFSNSTLLEEKYGKRSIQEMEYLNKVRTNLSCWTKGSGDNMALWKIYGGSKQSVAVSTIFSNMTACAGEWTKIARVKFKEVVYLDHSGKLPDGVYSLDENTFGIKHEAYSFEKEIRIVVTREHSKTSSPFRLPIKLNDFITKIIVAPESGDWFYNLVVDLANKYKVSAPVEKSQLSFLIEKSKKKEN